MAEIQKNLKNDEMSDSDVIRLVLDGDKESFKILVDRYSRFAVNLAYSKVTDYELASELAQDSLVKSYESLAKLQDHSKFGSWLYGIIKNTCLAYLKKKGRRRNVSLDSLEDSKAVSFESTIQAPDVIMMAAQKKDAVWKAVQSLNEKYRDVIVLFHFHSKSYEEIGKALDLEHKGVDSRLRRARIMLRDKLKKLIKE